PTVSSTLSLHDALPISLEKKQRFIERKDRIASLFRGEKRERFLQLLMEAESAIDAFDPDRGIKALEEAFKLDRDNYELSFFLGEDRKSTRLNSSHQIIS